MITVSNRAEVPRPYLDRYLKFVCTFWQWNIHNYHVGRTFSFSGIILPCGLWKRQDVNKDPLNHPCVDFCEVCCSWSSCVWARSLYRRLGHKKYFWPVSISYNNYNCAAPALPIYIDTCCHIVGYDFLVLSQVFRTDQINSMLHCLHLTKKISI